MALMLRITLIKLFGKGLSEKEKKREVSQKNQLESIKLLGQNARANQAFGKSLSKKRRKLGTNLEQKLE